MKESILKHYPTLSEKDFDLRDDRDGNGLYVENWKSELPEPTQEQINTWIMEEEFNLVKQNKLNELNKSCNQSILAGFFHVIGGIEYHFSFDVEAQLNFQGSRALLNEGLVPSIEWTVTVNGAYERILVDKLIMDELTLKILEHKDSNVRKLRNELMPLVETAATKEQLEMITW